MMLHLLTLGLHSYAQPYIDENVNHLESTLLSIVCIFTIGGTYFYSDDVEGDDKNQWSIALLSMFLLGATMTPLAVAFDVFNKRSADVAESVLTNRIKILMEVEPRATEDPACESEQPVAPNASRKSVGSSSSRRSSIGKGLLDLFDALEIGRSPQSSKVQPEEDVTKVCGMEYAQSILFVYIGLLRVPFSVATIRTNQPIFIVPSKLCIVVMEHHFRALFFCSHDPHMTCGSIVNIIL